MANEHGESDPAADEPGGSDPGVGRASLDSRALHLSFAGAGDETLGRALALVRLLRERCPWDARQTPESLRPYLLEEAHETAEAIGAGGEDELATELGDLLLNLAFQVVLAEERGSFTAGNVVARLEEKMRRRHPHVYGTAEEPPDWEALKAREREAGESAIDREEAGSDSPTVEVSASADPFAGVPETLEPLARGFRLQQRAAAYGFDWEDVAGPLAKVREELGELEEELDTRARTERGGTPPPPAVGEVGPGRPEAASAAGEGPSEPDAGGRLPGPPDPRLEEEVGDLLFAAVNLARRAGVHPSNALVAANRKFAGRFRRLLALAAARGIDPDAATLGELDRLWDEVKAADARDT